MRVRLATCLGLAALLAGCGSSSARTFRAEVHTVAVAQTTIAWYERGQGPPLAMLTGTGSTMAEWDPALLRLLAREHRLVLFDYPGVGLSGPWRGRSFDSLASATAALMDAIHIWRADVLGWSMGGFVAQRLAIEHPQRFAAFAQRSHDRRPARPPRHQRQRAQHEQTGRRQRLNYAGREPGPAASPGHGVDGRRPARGPGVRGTGHRRSQAAGTPGASGAPGAAGAAVAAPLRATSQR